jgi:hypothetical protein
MEDLQRRLDFRLAAFSRRDNARDMGTERIAVALFRNVDSGAQWTGLSELWNYHGPFQTQISPLSWYELITTIRDALTFRLRHDDLTRYNAVQKLLYIGIILVGMVVVLSGLSIWKPVQFSELTMLFYDFQTARMVHFLCMTAIVLFLIVHVALALLVPQSLIAMLTGGPIVKVEEPRADTQPVSG